MLLVPLLHLHPVPSKPLIPPQFGGSLAALVGLTATPFIWNPTCLRLGRRTVSLLLSASGNLPSRHSSRDWGCKAEQDPAPSPKRLKGQAKKHKLQGEKSQVVGDRSGELIPAGEYTEGSHGKESSRMSSHPPATKAPLPLLPTSSTPPEYS